MASLADTPQILVKCIGKPLSMHCATCSLQKTRYSLTLVTIHPHHHLLATLMQIGVVTKIHLVPPLVMFSCTVELQLAGQANNNLLLPCW